MSAPERLFIKRLHDGDGDIEEELRVCLVHDLGSDPGDKPVLTAAARPQDLAFVVARASDGWLVEFVRGLLGRSPERAMAVADALQHCEHVVLPPAKDTADLLNLRLAIDTHLGWPDPAAEQAADYVGRVKQAG